MAEPTQLIFNEAEVALPDTYVLPPGLDLKLHSVVAFIDGSAAGAAFKPALAIFAQSGQLMARVPVDQEFAAGDSGVVTWAPFLRKRSTGSAVSGYVGGGRGVVYDPTRLIATGTVTDLLAGTPVSAGQTVDSDFGQCINLPGASPWIEVRRGGPWTITLLCNWDSGAAFDRYIEVVATPNPPWDTGTVTTAARVVGATADDQFMIATAVFTATGNAASYPARFGANVWHNAAGNENCGFWLVAEHGLWDGVEG